PTAVILPFSTRTIAPLRGAPPFPSIRVPVLMAVTSASARDTPESQRQAVARVRARRCVQAPLRASAKVLLERRGVGVTLRLFIESPPRSRPGYNSRRFCDLIPRIRPRPAVCTPVGGSGDHPRP